MIEILPIRLLTDEDGQIFGNLNVALAKLHRLGFPVGGGIVVTAPQFKLKSILEHFDFETKEIFQQSLTLVNKEIGRIPVPEVLERETKNQKKFLLDGKETKSVKDLWRILLSGWLEQIKSKLWDQGFYQGITEGLSPKTVIFVKKIESLGTAYFDPMQDDVVVQNKGRQLHPAGLKKIADMVLAANKKLFLPHEYEWILDKGVKLTGLKPYTPPIQTFNPGLSIQFQSGIEEVKSAVKVFFELSTGFTIEKNVDPDLIGVDGIFIDSGKIFDLNRPRESFEETVFKLVESAVTFPNSPILFKLADLSEGMGKVRGALRLIHQKSLFEPLAEALDFTRHKKFLTNVHIVIPFVRGVNELLQIKRDLAVKKLQRKNSLELWMEAAVPENILNMENYLVAGIDGVVLNLDELVSYLNGFDVKEGELIFYKNEVEGLIKFLEDGIRLLHKSKVPFIAYGSLALYPKVLEFLVEIGVTGIVVERYEAHSAKDLLHQVEKRMVLRKFT